MMYYSNFNIDNNLNLLKESLILDDLQKELIKEAQLKWLQELWRRAARGYARYFRGAEPVIRTAPEEAARIREAYEYFIGTIPQAPAETKGVLRRAYERIKGTLTRTKRPAEAAAPTVRGPGELYWQEVAPVIPGAERAQKGRIQRAFEKAKRKVTGKTPETAAQPAAQATARTTAQTAAQTAPTQVIVQETPAGRAWIAPVIGGAGLAAGMGLAGYALGRRRRREIEE
jgi:hypothetical protein